MSDEKPTFPVKISGIWNNLRVSSFVSSLTVNKNDQITFENESKTEIKTVYSISDQSGRFHLWTVNKDGTLTLKATYRKAKTRGPRSSVKPVIKKSKTPKTLKRRGSS
mmetsp:Transcript_4645/g.6981  ORF Transcript_4645/g.6981 Transcript_4645/m.6981 type:complete len:108 (+) Transcript_4645:32-355(+)